MNAGKMTREEFEVLTDELLNCDSHEEDGVKNKMWSRIQAIQSAPFVPDWNLKPEWAKGFWGTWTPADINPRPGEFYIPAPSNPSDAELSAMWEKLDRDKRVQILRDAGVEV